MAGIKVKCPKVIGMVIDLNMIHVLSIKQPWAWAIFHAGKDVENRTWPAKYRGGLYIHASKSFDYSGYRYLKTAGRLDAELPAKEAFQRGGLVGYVYLTDCVKEYESPWFFGPYGFVFKDPQAINFVRMPGQLGIFKCDYRQGGLF